MLGMNAFVITFIRHQDWDEGDGCGWGDEPDGAGQVRIVTPPTSPPYNLT